MAFWDLAVLSLEEFRPGIMSKLVMGDQLNMVYMEIGPGMEDKGHQHPFDQCGIVLEGEMEMFIGQDRRVLKENHCYFIRCGQYHGWKTFHRPVRILDISLRQEAKG